MGKKTKAAVLAGVPTAYGEISFDVGLASEPGPAPYAVTPLEVNAARIHAFVESGVPVALIPALAAALGLAPEVLALRCGLSRPRSTENFPSLARDLISSARIFSFAMRSCSPRRWTRFLAIQSRPRNG